MSGEAQHDDTRGETCLVPGDRVKYVRRYARTAGVVAVAFALLVGCWLFFACRYGCNYTRVDWTRVKIATIENYVQDYKNRHGEYPPSLAVLTVPEDGKAAPDLEQRDLMDDWGTPIRYDPKVIGPSGKPKIFAVTPEGDEICNW
jgi:hypothetical protein